MRIPYELMDLIRETRTLGKSQQIDIPRSIEKALWDWAQETKQVLNDRKGKAA